MISCYGAEFSNSHVGRSCIEGMGKNLVPLGPALKSVSCGPGRFPVPFCGHWTL